MRPVSRLLCLVLGVVLTVSGLSLVAPSAAQAAGTVLVTESFSGTSVGDPSWRALNSACLTRSTSATAPNGSANLAACTSRVNAPSSSTNPGFLQLTDARGGQTGGVVYNQAIPGNGGVVVTFDQWQYGGNGADGVGFFLSDGSVDLTQTGASGGSLGYAPNGATPGVNGGYVGIGLDAYGNYANPTEGRDAVSCGTRKPNQGFVPNAVSLRGPGEGLTRYCWLAGTTSSNGSTSTLPGNLRGSSAADSERRTVRITVSPEEFPLVTVELDFHGGPGFQQVISYRMTDEAPATYKLGFLGSTGGSNDTHLVRNVAVSSVNTLGRLNLVKHIDNRVVQPDAYAEGATISYSFVVTNTSNLAPLTAVAVSDPLVTNISCPQTTLGALATMVCTGTHVVTAAEAAQPALTNTATATAQDGATTVTSAPSSVDAPIATPAPALSLTKSASVIDRNGNGSVEVGDELSYSFAVTNTGNVTVQGITVSDPRVAATTPASLSLAPGASGTLTATTTRVVTQADIDAGQALTNTATVNGTTFGGTPVASPASTATVPVAAQSPQLTLLKTATLTDADGDGVADVGDSIAYSFLVTNTGNVTATNVTIDDPRVTGVTPASVATLAPGTPVTFNAATHVVTQAEVDAGVALTNSAVARATTTRGTAIASATSSTTTPLANQVPGLTLTKTATLQDTNGNNLANVGETIQYGFTAVNTGNVTLTGVTVTDPRVTAVTPASVASLAPATPAQFSASYVVTQADVDAGTPILNTATVTGSAPSGATVTATGSASVPVPVPAPSLALVKAATLSGGDAIADVGDTITYTIDVTNAGNVTVQNVAVTDPSVTGLTPASVASLTPGQTVRFTAAARVVTQADIDRGTPIVNTASAAGTAGGATVTAPSGSVSVPVRVAAPVLTLTKIATLNDTNANGTADEGETISYAFDARNAGNVSLFGVAITDATATGLSPASADIPVGQTVRFTAADHLVTQAEVDAGGAVQNLATAQGATLTGTAVPSGPSTTSVPITAATPAMSLVKAPVLGDTDADGRASAGESLSYTFDVTNTGNVTLTNVGIDDPDVTGITPVLVTLLPGQTQRFTSASRPVTQAEVDAGADIMNTALASANPPSGPAFTSQGSTATVRVALPAPAMTFAKEATFPGGALTPLHLGDVVVYRFVATNTGNVTLSGVAVQDPFVTGVTPASADIGPGQSVTFTAAAYTVLQEDVDAGAPIVNTASALGQTPSGQPFGSATSSTSLAVVAADPSLSVVKTAALSGGHTAAQAGDTLSYAFLVTNTGNVTLSNIDVVDPQVTGITPGNVTLAPGQSQGFTADPRLVTQADVDAGAPLVNSAVATAYPPVGAQITSDPSEVTVPVATAAPALRLTMTDSSGGSVTPGSTVRYTVTAANVGNVTLTGVSVENDLRRVLALTTLSGPITTTRTGATGADAVLNGTTVGWTGTIDVGGSLVFVVTVVVGDSVAAGTVIPNSATATATGIPGAAEAATAITVQSGALPVTGAPELLGIVLLGAGLVLLGSIVVIGRMAARRRAEQGTMAG